MTDNLKEKVIEIIKEWLKGAGFHARKLTDTPTDALQVVNKKYVDDNGLPSYLAPDGTTVQIEAGSGAAGTNAQGSQIEFDGGLGDGTGSGGAAYLSGGSGGANGAGGLAIIQGGSAGGGNNDGGDILFFSGTSSGSGSPGNFRFDPSGPISTTATGGFITIPNCNGAPTGIPLGGYAMVYDYFDSKLYIYDFNSSTWKSVTLS